MNAPTFVLALPHTPWVEARVDTFTRLCKTLAIDTEDDVVTWEDEAEGNGLRDVVISKDRAPNHEWSGRLWSLACGNAEDGNASHIIQLQDDVRPCERFWPKLRALVGAYPQALICLENPHPGAMTAAREGKRWYVTRDGLVGVGYVLPTRMLRAFIDWRALEVKAGSLALVTEDTLLAIFAMAHEIPIVCPIPTIIEHDTSIASSYAGNDAHPYRRPAVTWEHGDILGFEPAQLETAEFWAPSDENVVHFGCFYSAVQDLAVVHTKSFTVDDAKRIKASSACPAKYARHFR